MNVLFACVHRCFPCVKLRVHPRFTIEIRHFPLFSRTANAVKFRETHCSPEFTARLTYGKHIIFLRSQKFSPVFLYFPRKVNSREFKKTHIFQLSPFGKRTEIIVYSCVFRSSLAFSLTANAGEFKKTLLFPAFTVR